MSLSIMANTFWAEGILRRIPTNKKLVQNTGPNTPQSKISTTDSRGYSALDGCPKVLESNPRFGTILEAPPVYHSEATFYAL